MASRSYVFPLPATNTGSRIITLVMGHKSSSGSSSPGNVGVSASFLWTPTPDVESASFVRAVSGSDTGTPGSASAAGTLTSPSEVISAGAGSPTARPSTGRRVPSRRDTLSQINPTKRLAAGFPERKLDLVFLVAVINHSVRSVSLRVIEARSRARMNP